ncbi:ATP-binding protein [Caloranaerobacter azorensis H53214]|uniref:Iron-only hydrogenase maturation protein HydF n=2 Tax=Caloranaerobacter azorensis TaxID=116090 RepID=A0A1M5UP38_9FIRM|nr:[FeFe] hydrogenase H-cluster maturation GTPase HydF [Caloranaerobacter azorensis]KGG81292.1 ATP-binding protein [Caloranaerobacter azorensis H53214]SHH64735.1 iron-only hydrogenase maturation protein HydF [Caloranaerobacter azorensis DSM 13643]
MSLNDTPRSTRVHIALFGKRNSGKSSIINAITNQEIAIVSDVKGTTTDPVYKSIEILPIGPCVIIDTAGLDDVGDLGELRIKKSMEVLNKTDVALFVIDATVGITDEDRMTINRIKEKKIPLIIVLNKADISEVSNEDIINLKKEFKVPVLAISALKKQGINELKKKIISILPEDEDKFKIVGDLIEPGDFVVLVTPIDKAAPKGRLILPQQQTIRDILESDAIAIVTKEYELKETLENLSKKPKLVITDSQAFLKVAADTPKDILMTSFSILFARFKGDLVELVKGVKAIEKLKDGDKILVSEGCTHHRQADDIGRVKIPRWIRQITGKKLEFEFSSGSSFPDDVQKYSLIVHCGGCMLNRRGMLYRINSAKSLNIPIVNYGVMIAYVHGILDRALEPFPLAKMVWDE